MKVLGVLCVFACIAGCVLSSGYLPGKEYVYKYKGKVFTEIDQQHHQHAGFAIKSQVHVQPKQDYFLVKIDHVVFDQVNERVTEERGYNFNYAVIPALTESLEKPFKIFFEHGLVHHVSVAKDDPIWSVNLKKSLAALFQLNFDQINSVRSKEGTQLKEPDLDAHYFKVVEDSLYGECETMYEVSHEPSHFAPYTIPVLNVTKSTNFAHCNKMPYYAYENINYAQCVECDSDLIIPDRLSNVVHYNLRGDRHNFVVEKIHIESEFTHMPFTRNGDMVYLHTNRTLLLLEEHDVKEEIHLADEVVQHFDLHFHFYGQHGFKDLVDLKEPHFLYYFLSKSAEIDLVGKDFNDLIEPIIDGTFPDKFKEHQSPHKFAELVKHVNTLGYDDIEKIYKQYVDVTSDDPHAILARTQLFFEILSSSGTNPSFLFAKNHLFDDGVLPPVALHFISMLPFTIKEASESLFDEIYKLCESEKVHAKPHLQNVCYLSLSSLINEHCVGKNYQRLQKIPSALGAGCTPEIAKKYFDQVVHHFENDHDEIELITGIKATGNFGLKEGVEYLRKYIENDHFPTYFRVAAIWALRRVAQSYPESVFEELVPVYFNLSEGHEVRLAAFGVIISAHPSRAILEAIGVSLHEEHNHQVVSYVSSAFHYLAHSDYPCHKAVKSDIEHVLRHVLRLDSLPDFDFKHSKYWMNSGYNEEFGFGGMSEVSYVTSNDSYLPSKLYLGASDYFADRHIPSIAVVLNQEGLDKVIDRVFGPEGLFNKKKSFFDIFHRSRVARDTASVEKELKEIDETLHIKNRHEREIHGDISVRMFGHEVSFFYFNESLFENFLHDGYFSVPDIQDILKNAPSFTYTRFFVQAYAALILPSPVGFPFFLSYQEPTSIYYKNNEFKFEVSPSVFSEDRNNEAPKTVTLHAKGHFIHDTVRRGVLGLSLLFEHKTIGVGLIRRTYFNDPVNIDLVIDLKNHKVQLKSGQIKNHPVFHTSAHPFSFIDDYSNEVDIVDEKQYLPYYKPEEMKEVHESHLHDYLGYGFDVKAKYGKLNIFQSKEHAHKYFKTHSLRDAYYTLLFNPHFASFDVDVDFSVAEDDPTEEVDLDLEFGYHDLKSNMHFHSERFDHHADLEDHSKALPGRKFYTYWAKADLHRKGNRGRKVLFEGAYTHSCDHKLQKYTLYYDRTPHTAEETEHFKVCANAYMRYPDYDLKKLHDLDTLELDQQVHALAKIGFGKDCTDDHKFSVHGILKRSQHQIEKESQRELVDHIHFNPYSHFYHKCLDEHKRGAYYGFNCRYYIYLATRLHHYDIDFDFETPMPDDFINATKHWLNWFDHQLYYHMDKNYIVAPGRSDKIEFHFDFDPVDDLVDIEVLKKFATTHYGNVEVDHVYAPVSASPYLAFTNNYRFNHVFRPSLCSVEGEYITTFDNVTYHLPETDCWKVLAKDCSDHEYFLVLGKKTNNANYPKAVKVFLGKAKVEILPVTDSSHALVRVNGIKVDVSESTPYFYHSGTETEEVPFYVIYNGLYYTINSDKYGVHVYYDGKAIVSHISPYYKGKQCGLCGDYNHEHDREFRGPEDCVYHNVSDFGASYVIHEDGCHAPPVNPNACEKPREK